MLPRNPFAPERSSSASAWADSSQASFSSRVMLSPTRRALSRAPCQVAAAQERSRGAEPISVYTSIGFTFGRSGMQQASVRAIIRALNDANVEYLIAGGLAVVAHGYVRFTKDVDVVLHLERANTLRALTALKRLGYQPMVAAVKMEDLADPGQRKTWVEEKGATVFTLYSDEHRLTPIDIFVEEPFDFHRAARDAHHGQLGDLSVPFVSLADLIAMKRRADRPIDRADLVELERIAHEP
jgi:predicted nucleotidyltransferase